MKKRTIHTLLIIMVLFTLAGCKEPDFKAENEALTERVAELSKENLTLNDRIEGLKKRQEYFPAEVKRLEAERNALAIELKALKSRSAVKKRRRRR